MITRTFTKWESFEAKIVFELVSGLYTLDDIEAILGDNGEIMLKSTINGGSCTYRYLGEEGGGPQDKTVLDFLERLRTNVRILSRDQKDFYNILGYFDPKEILRFAKERKCDLSTIDVHLDWIENALIFEVTAKGPEDAEYLVSLGETWVPVSKQVMTHEKMDELLSFASVGDVPSYVVSPSGEVAYVERTLDDSLVVYYGASTLPRAQELYEASAPLGEQLGTVFDYLEEEENGYRLDEFPHYSLEDLADNIRSYEVPEEIFLEEEESEEEMQESVEELQRVLAALAANPNADPTLVMASEATLNAMDFFLNQDTSEAAQALTDPVGIFVNEFKKFKELESTKGEKVEVEMNSLRDQLDAASDVTLLDAVRKAMLGTLKARQDERSEAQEPEEEENAAQFFNAFFEGLVEAAESGAFGINPFEGLSEEDWAPFNPEKKDEDSDDVAPQVEAPSDSGFGNLFGVVAAVAVVAAGVAATQQPKRLRLSTQEKPRVQKDVDAYEEAEGDSLALTSTLAR